MESLYCVCCGCRIRKRDKEMEYVGIVCSKCFRMSTDRYYKVVDELCKRRTEEILRIIETNRIKE